MTWIKLATALPTHDRLLDLPPDRCWFYVACLCYAGEHLTDGHIRAGRLRFVDVTYPDPADAMADLVAAGLLAVDADGWTIVNYLTHQRSAEQVRSQRDASRARAARARSVRAYADRTDTAPTPHVREQSRVEKSAHPTPTIHNHPQVIHRCPTCDTIRTDYGCDCDPKETP